MALELGPQEFDGVQVGRVRRQKCHLQSGLSERPTRVRTWAPKGRTPIIQFHFNWTHLSVIAGLSRANFLFRLHEGSIKKKQHVEFLKALRAHLKRPLLIIWDGLPARSRHVTAGGQEEVHRLAELVDGAVQVLPLAAFQPGRRRYRPWL